MDAGIFDYFLNLDKHLHSVISEFRGWTYALLFGTVFAETGLVITAILPGDSLVFASAALAARGDALDIRLLLLLFAGAAFCGDQVNFLAGNFLGRRPFRKDGRFFNIQQLRQAEAFYRRHGAQAILFGRFIPVIRCFIPFSAALGGMPYLRFLPYSVLGASLWTGAFGLIGFFFGNVPFVRRNFLLVVIGIVVVSLLPGFIQYLAGRRGRFRVQRPK